MVRTDTDHSSADYAGAALLQLAVCGSYDGAVTASSARIADFSSFADRCPLWIDGSLAIDNSILSIARNDWL